MTLPDPVEARRVAEGLSEAELAPFAHRAAVRWCGEKGRETFPEDIAFFKNTWRWADGFRARVVAEAVRSILKGTDSHE